MPWPKLFKHKKKNKANDAEEQLPVPAKATLVVEGKTTAATGTPKKTKQGTKGFGNGHNCPHKDAASTHVFSPRCIKLNHCGYCPECNMLVSYFYGCSRHRFKKEELLKEPIPDFDLHKKIERERAAAMKSSIEIPEPGGGGEAIIEDNAVIRPWDGGEAAAQLDDGGG